MAMQIILKLLLICEFCAVLTHGQTVETLTESGGVIVHLFEWKWKDIAQECEDALAPLGYSAVQTSPVFENIKSSKRSWWERYQPVTFELDTRSGNESDFIDMVDRCNAVGIKVFVDVVFNNMASDLFGDNTTGAGTPNTKNLMFPDIPFSAEDFHAKCEVTDYNDVVDVQTCRVLGCPDLNQTRTNVQNILVDNLNRLIDMGVSGVRIDDAKHMNPNDLKNILEQLNRLPGSNEPLNVFLETIDFRDEAVSMLDYKNLGLVTEFKYATDLSAQIKSDNGIHNLKNFKDNFELVDSEIAIVFVCNHDNQRETVGGKGILTYKDKKLYIIANAFMLAYPYGSMNKILSSYDFTDKDQGPPTVANEDTILSPVFDNNDQCERPWVCEHRWHQIYNMVQYHNIGKDNPIENWWDNGGNKIAFSLGNKAFMAINQDNTDLSINIQTGLSAGIYCDVISSATWCNTCCPGIQIIVDENGFADIEIATDDPNGVVAIHIASKIS